MTVTSGSEMPTHLRHQLEDRVRWVTARYKLPEVLPNLQTVRWMYGATLDEVVGAVAVTDPALASDFRRWAL